MKKIKTAVCGTGFGADTIVPVLKELGHYDIVSLSGGRNSLKTRRIAERFGIPEYFDSFEKMLDGARFDLVFIASPHELHKKMVELAAARGLHIVCEKPLALSLNDVQSLTRIPNTARRLRLVNHQLPFLPVFGRIREIIGSGRIGKLKRIRIDFNTDRLAHPGTTWNWWFDPRSGGGMLLAMGTHMAGLAEYFCGERALRADAFMARGIESVPAAGGKIRRQDTESIFSSRLFFKKDLFAELLCSGISREGTILKVELQGSRGEIIFDDRTGARFYSFAKSGARRVIPLKNGSRPGEAADSIYRLAFRRFAEQLAKRINSSSDIHFDLKATSFEGYLRQFIVLESLRRAARTRSAVQIPLLRGTGE